jgi:hypothetical protein
MADERDSQIDKYESEFWTLIETSFKLRLEGMSTSASPFLDSPISFEARFPSKNRNLRNSPYYYSNNNKLIHFTSLSALYSIINEGAIRLYNLHNSNDEDEYTYASKMLENIYHLQGVKGEQLRNHLDKVKEYSFTLSCTTHKGLESSDFWNEYSDNGRGVAIEFEILNSYDDWEYFYCSEIHYNRLDDFKELKNKWEQLVTTNNHINYHINLNQFLSLHKSSKWENEKEIRLLTVYPDFYSGSFETRLYEDFKLSKCHKNIRYFKLPLCDKNGKFLEKDFEQLQEYYSKLIPKVRISDVYFGPNFPKKASFWNFQNDLKHYIAGKLDCWLTNLPRTNSCTCK